ncbi:1-aminocyclopropane-1-carboxylate synthase [Plectosphaerella plurivora]|uniref:1-aminocyclopropane-1-carboxylate synthase n=1 Tax=Plectosphaerella plurivora TaxID=936078 RepID=A0A9P8VI69_9PEZI|nr:1-aminocyclopropane-1-carboxylate synthase [Plectosphaerella plurivora]
MLSQRAIKTASQLDIPWRFVPAGKDRYDPVTKPNGIVSLATAENPLMHQELADFASEVEIPPAAFTYSYSSLGGPRLQAALATHINETFVPFTNIPASDIQVFDGATALHSLLSFSLAEAGDAILVSRPVYGRFELDFGNEHNVRILYAENSVEDGLKPVVVESFDRAFSRAEKEGIKIRAVLIVNPSNPLGRCYPRETLVEIMKFCQQQQLHLISDEVYGLSVFDANLSAESAPEKSLAPFTSALSIDTDGLIDPNLLHVEYGTSKDFAAAGLRLGVLITRNRELQRALRTVVRFHEPSGPSTVIGSAMFEDREWCRNFIALARQRIADAYEFATAHLRDIGIEYLPANAGFFVFVNLEPWLPPAVEGLSQQAREFRLAEELVKGGIFLHPGEEHALEPGRFRLVYTANRQAVDEGFRRLMRTLGALPWTT